MKQKWIFVVTIVSISIINGCISPRPGPNDPYIEGPTYIRINEEAVYRIKNLGENINIAEIKWILYSIDDLSTSYSLGSGLECKLVITEEMIKENYIHKDFSLVAYYEEREKTRSLEKIIRVLDLRPKSE